MVELIITTMPWGLAGRADERFVVTGPGPVGPVPSGTHPILYCDGPSPPHLDESDNALDLQAGITTHQGERGAIYEFPVPLRRTQPQLLRRSGSSQSVEIIWDDLLSRPSRKDTDGAEDDPNRRQFQLLMGLVARMQDFNIALTGTARFLPWESAFLGWLDQENNQDPTMDILVHHAAVHRARWTEIADRPKRLLNRTRDLVNLSRVKELDTHCMAWLSRQSGRTTPERAGPRQRILAQTRYENLNTLENRVFRDLLERSDAAAREYLRQNHQRRVGQDARGGVGRYTMVEHYAWECRHLARELAASGINRLEGPVQPNFVLMQDVRYRHVWTAWKEIVARERWYDDLWRWQRRAWAEFARVACGVALQAVYGGEIEFASPLSFQNEHRRGEWVMHDNPLVVLAFREIGVVIEVLDGCADELTDALSRLGSSAFLRFSDMQGRTQQYIAVWTVLTMANAASLADLVASADETIEFFQQTQPDARLAGGFILQSEANPEADADIHSSANVTGVSLGPFDRHLAKGLEILGAEIVEFVKARL